MNPSSVLLFSSLALTACGVAHSTTTASATASSSLSSSSSSAPGDAGVDAPPAPPAPLDGSLVLATLDAGIAWIGVEDNEVYFALNEGPIESVPAAGGAAPSVVVPVSPTGGAYVTNGLAFDESHLYWSEGYGGPSSNVIYRAPLSGGDAEQVASSDSWIGGLTVVGDTLYWVAQDSGTILSAPVGGGAATTVVSGLSAPAGIVIHAGVIYFTDANSDLISVPVQGGTVTTLLGGPGEPPNQEAADFSPVLVADDANVYYPQYYAPTPLLVKVPIGQTKATTLAPGSAYGIAVDATRVYFLNSDGYDISAVSIAGGAVDVLAASQSLPVGPAIDDNSVYWATSENAEECGLCGPPTGKNQILKIAK